MSIKRILDILIAGTALLLAAPVLLLTAWIIRKHIGRPVLFRQQRIGYRERQFTIYKFRTMSEATDRDGTLLPDHVRLTKLGRVLRRTSLDELPQLWNVINGDMSLVGPRPLLPQYLPRYTYAQRRRHEKTPGITGWAQVNGRNSLTWEKRFELDVWYVDNQSLWLDLRIMWMTLSRVLGRRGIEQSGHATMPEFLGSSLSQSASVKGSSET